MTWAFNQANIVSCRVSNVDAAYDKSCFNGLLPSSILGQIIFVPIPKRAGQKVGTGSLRKDRFITLKDYPFVLDNNDRVPHNVLRITKLLGI